MEPTLEPQPAETIVEQAPPPSVWSRIANVIASPSEAFEGVAQAERKTALWLVPMILTIVVSIGSVALTMSNPAVQGEMRAIAEQKINDAVKNGKMTQEQADKAMEFQSNDFMQAVAYVSPLFGVPISYLILAGVFYLIVAFILGGKAPFISVFAVVSLSGVVKALELIVTSLLIYAAGTSAAQPNLASLVHAGNVTVAALLAQVNPFTIWWLIVLGVGFSKTTGLTMKKAVIAMFALWLLWSGVMAGIANIPLFQTGKGGPGVTVRVN